MATFLIVHGAWTGGWFWKKLRPLLQSRGHEVFTPTCTGVGERTHLDSAHVDLDTHIADILNVLEFEDLHDVILIGHSYGGMVATGVADRASARIRQVIYIDAFVPRNGESVQSLLPEARAQALDAISLQEEGQGIPPNPMPPDTSEEDAAWAVPRRMAQPFRTFVQPIQLTGKVDALPRTYLYCTRPGPGDVFRQFAGRARNDAAWTYIEIDSSHNPQVTMPEELARLLHELSDLADQGKT